MFRLPRPLAVGLGVVPPALLIVGHHPWIGAATFTVVFATLLLRPRDRAEHPAPQRVRALVPRGPGLEQVRDLVPRGPGPERVRDVVPGGPAPGRGPIGPGGPGPQPGRGLVPSGAPPAYDPRDDAADRPRPW